MNKGVMMGVLLLGGVMTGAWATENNHLDPLVACYSKAGESADKQHVCLEKERASVQEAYKVVSERVMSYAKGQEIAGNRDLASQALRANQSFESYYMRECLFAKNALKGTKVEKENAALACEIGLLRIRVGQLENRYLK